ncbi:MAG: c-type cytochrome [Pseudomonadota bacterium]
MTAWPVFAAEDTAGPIGSDVEYGAYLSQECKTCHRLDGEGQGIPSFLNLSAPDFVIAMNAFKTRQRQNQTMQMIAGRLSDEDIAALAAYFTQQVHFSDR